MDSHVLLRGFVLGLAIAAPIGPIGALVIRRSLTDGMVAGFCAGLGAAVADALYAAVAALGVASSSRAFTTSWPFHWFAAGLLAWLGVQALRARPTLEPRTTPLRGPDHGRAFVSTLALTLANPATIASFAAASTAIGVGVGSSPRFVTTFAGSVFAGSASWWLLLSTATSALRERLGPRALRATHVVAGAALLGFAVFALRR